VTNTGNAYFSNVRPEAFIVPVYLCRGTHIHAMISAIGAERSYAQTKGNTASNFSFQGASLGQQIETVPFLAATRTEPGKRLTNIYIYMIMGALRLPFHLNFWCSKICGLDDFCYHMSIELYYSGSRHLESPLSAYARY